MLLFCTPIIEPISRSHQTSKPQSRSSLRRVSLGRFNFRFDLHSDPPQLRSFGTMHSLTLSFRFGYITPSARDRPHNSKNSFRARRPQRPPRTPPNAMHERNQRGGCRRAAGRPTSVWGARTPFPLEDGGFLRCLCKTVM